MADWVLAVERAYVAAATSAAQAQAGTSAADIGRARAAIGAIASHYLAVGTPRSIGLVAWPSTHADAELSLEAHRTWFAPREVRCAALPGLDHAQAETLARTVGGVATSFEEALAADIVCIHASCDLRADQLRRGTHINVLAAATLDDELRRVATVVDEVPGLGQLAAGLVDGRQLDELTVFVAGDAAIALAALR